MNGEINRRHHVGDGGIGRKASSTANAYRRRRCRGRRCCGPAARVASAARGVGFEPCQELSGGRARDDRAQLGRHPRAPGLRTRLPADSTRTHTPGEPRRRWRGRTRCRPLATGPARAIVVHVRRPAPLGGREAVSANGSLRSGAGHRNPSGGKSRVAGQLRLRPPGSAPGREGWLRQRRHGEQGVRAAARGPGRRQATERAFAPRHCTSHRCHKTANAPRQRIRRPARAHAQSRNPDRSVRVAHARGSSVEGASVGGASCGIDAGASVGAHGHGATAAPSGELGHAEAEATPARGRAGADRGTTRRGDSSLERALRLIDPPNTRYQA
jgi:hypothetical protein